MIRVRALLWIGSTASALALAAFAATGGAPLRADAWLPLASPGPLAKAHGFLGARCSDCHAPFEGVTASRCILCHAGNQSLFRRESTAFHASIGSCSECHLEHLGAEQRPTQMDHRALAVIGLRDVARFDASAERRLRGWLRVTAESGRAGAGTPLLDPEEALLDCASCHSKKDRHVGMLGPDCASCHAASSWRVPGFRHPSPESTTCAECHAPPPSHLMGHFQMVSMVVAKKPHARVAQCYECHLTTAWNDIRDVGWYDHH